MHKEEEVGCTLMQLQFQQWMLHLTSCCYSRALRKFLVDMEEQREVKPKDPEGKKRIDEVKDILKRFIRTKSIPRTI